MAGLSEAFTRMRHDFDRARQDRMEMIEDWRSEANQRAVQMSRQLAEQAGTRMARFAASFQALRSENQRQAEQTKRRLAEFAADLRQGGEAFRRRPRAR